MSETEAGGTGEKRSLAGTRVETPDDAARQRAAEAAFDYRGDVTLVLRDARKIEGFVFDRRLDVASACVRLMTEAGERIPVDLADIAAIEFSSHDPAAGRSWETWVRKKGLSGEA